MMFDYYKSVLFDNYANFKGRARRSEFWYYNLVNMIIYTVIMGLAGATGETGAMIFGGLYLLYALGTIVPSLAVIARRLHDIDKSGWTYLFILIPIVGFILMLVWFCTEGTRGPNNYGKDPKAGVEQAYT